jgi:hypothetical protein
MFDEYDSEHMYLRMTYDKIFNKYSISYFFYDDVIDELCFVQVVYNPTEEDVVRYGTTRKACEEFLKDNASSDETEDYTDEELSEETFISILEVSSARNYRRIQPLEGILLVPTRYDEKVIRTYGKIEV